MTVYVDNLFNYGKKGTWCHMAVAVGDDIEELHQFAERIGLKREWFQDHPTHPHYDLRLSKRIRAISCGAVAVDNLKFVKLCSKFMQGDNEAVQE